MVERVSTNFSDNPRSNVKKIKIFTELVNSFFFFLLFFGGGGGIGGGAFFKGERMNKPCEQEHYPIIELLMQTGTTESVISETTAVHSLYGETPY